MASNSEIGSVQRISLAVDHAAGLEIVDEAQAVAGSGLKGDRHCGAPARQISIQSRTELKEASQKLGRDIDPDLTRRNITIDKGDLPRNRGQRLFIGEVELEVFADAAPCELMTTLIGEGARPALTRLAGIHCKIISDGQIYLGDKLMLSEA